VKFEFVVPSSGSYGWGIDDFALIAYGPWDRQYKVEFDYTTDTSGTLSDASWILIGTDDDGSDGWKASWTPPSVNTVNLRAVLSSVSGVEQLGIVDKDFATNITIDKVAPVITDVSVAPKWIRSGDVLTLTGTFTEANPDTLVIAILSGTEVITSITYFSDVLGGIFGSPLSFSVPVPSDLSEGEHHAVFLAVDKAGNESDVCQDTFNIDNTQPTIHGTKPEPNGIISDATPEISANFTDTGSGISTATAVMTIDGETVDTTTTAISAGITYQVSSATPLSEGVHTVTVDVKDIAGNTANQLVWTFVVDTEGAETVCIVQPLVDSYLQGTVSLEAVVSDVWAGVTKVEFFATTATVAAGGIPITSDTSQPWTGTWNTASGSYADGTWYLYAIATDLVGNTATSSLIGVVVDNADPVATGSVAPDWVRSGDVLTLTAALTDANADTLAVYIEDPGTGEDWAIMSLNAPDAFPVDLSAGCTLNISVPVPSDLAEGTYSVGVIFVDRTGNMIDVNLDTFDIDNTQPTIHGTKPEPNGIISDATPGISANFTDTGGSGIDTSTAVMTLDGETVASVALTTGITYQVTTALSDGVHTVTVDVKDIADNTAYQLVWTFVVDTEGPETATITRPKNGDMVKGTIEIVAVVSDVWSGVSEVSFYHDEVSPATLIATDVTPSEWSATWDTASGATAVPDGTHKIIAVAKDELGNESTGEVTVVVDNTAPILIWSTVTLPYGPITDASGQYYIVFNKDIEIQGVASDSATFVRRVTFKVSTAAASGNLPDVGNAIPPEKPFLFGFQWTLVPTIRTTITVTAYDAVGNSTSKPMTLEYAAPEVTKVIGEKVIGKYGGAVSAADGTKINIPEGALDRETLISIYLVVEESLPSVGETDVKRTPFARIFGPEDIVFLKWVTITIPYYQWWIDIQTAEGWAIDESKLALFYWDGLRWNRVSEAGDVDTTNNTITAKVNHGGLFCMMEDSRTPTAGFDFYLVNNPFSPNGDGEKDSTLFKYRLDNPGTVTIEVYDMAGDLVKTLADGVSITDTGWYHEAKWNGDNDFANYVGSGIYVFKFYVKFTDGSTKTIIKPVGVIK